MAIEARLSIRNLSVSFGRNRALDSLDLDIPPGRIVALLGANGSGKSTAVKALTGINSVRPGAVVRLGGQLLDAGSMNPASTRQLGVRVVHQEAPMVPSLTVAEAMAVSLGFPTTAGLIRWRRLADESRRRMEQFAISVDPERLCATLSAPERALVSLAIALGDIAVNSAVLILDEATASLSTEDADRFLAHVRDVARRGLSVLMVTHRLPEVREYCDEMVVLRDGVAVARFDHATFDERAVVHAMVGSGVEATVTRDGAVAQRRDDALVVTCLVGSGVNDVSFRAAVGEILGIAGRPGGGAAEVLRMLGGIDVARAGRIDVGGEPAVIRVPRHAIRHGMFYISPDRLTEGGVATMSVAENLTLPRVERYGFNRSRAASDVARMIAALDVRPPDPAAIFGNLSGGNQQKVLLGRWLLLEPRILLLDDPTVGVDPNTRELLFETLRELATQGTTILLRSSEPEQLARLCDRVLVVRDGRVVDELTGDRITTEEISLATYA